MRVIAGALKGRKLKWPDDIRPTRDFVKEALFNILGDISGKVIYDICAGSGSLGLEALSRGARKVFFVEKEKSYIPFIKDNLKGIQPQHFEIINASFETLMNLKADIVFFDPPYAQSYDLIFDRVKNVDCLVTESNREIAHPDFKRVDYRKYGTTYLSFFKQL